MFPTDIATRERVEAREEDEMLGALHMGWRHVCFANWPVDPSIVRPHVPDGMTIDTFDGDAWLSVIPFTNVDVRPPWVPDGWGIRLPELNLRTYVDCGDDPGVYFFSLDAQGVISVLGARLFHRLPYYYARTGLTVEDGTVTFRSRRRHPGERPVEFDARYRPQSDEFRAESGSLAEFLTERYRYYTEASDGRIRYADISHEPWPLFEAEVDIRENTLFASNGFATPDSKPIFYYSPGVETQASASALLSSASSE